MANELFIIVAALAAGLMLGWGFRHLPRERWQVLACLPLAKDGQDGWRGLNLTWYGLLSANAQALAAAWLFMLMSSLGVGWPVTAGLTLALMGLCLPLSRWLAHLVEKKAHTFTVGGASFCGLIAAPFLGWWGGAALSAWTGGPVVEPLAWCAALTTAYALGEGLGRLACISFGCCYGRPLEECPPILRRLFARAHFVFQGPTKKIAYASGLEGRPVFPIQAVSAVVNLAAALIGSYLFLRGAFTACLLVTALTAQLWRVASEFLRADYRGQGRISAYQKLALLAALWSLGLAWLLPAASASRSDLLAGLAALWSPGPLLIVQGLWLVCLTYYGLSRVTGSRITLWVAADRV